MKRQLHFFALLSLLLIETSTAANCPSTRIDLTTLQIDIPCAVYAEQAYFCTLQIAPGLLGAQLLWKLDATSLAPSACAVTEASCATLLDTLDMSLRQMDIGGTAHTAELGFIVNSDDPNGLYWQYLSHQPASDMRAINLRVSYYSMFKLEN